MISIKWLGRSVSGLVVIAGIISILIGQQALGTLFVLAGLGGAVVMTAIIKG